MQKSIDDARRFDVAIGLFNASHSQKAALARFVDCKYKECADEIAAAIAQLSACHKSLLTKD